MAIGDNNNSNLFGTDYNSEEEERKKAELAAQNARMGATGGTQDLLLRSFEDSLLKGQSQNNPFGQAGIQAGQQFANNIQESRNLPASAFGQAPASNPFSVQVFEDPSFNTLKSNATDDEAAAFFLSKAVQSELEKPMGQFDFTKAYDNAAQEYIQDLDLKYLSSRPRLIARGVASANKELQEYINTFAKPDSPQGNFLTRMETGEDLTPQEIQSAQAFATSMGTTFDPKTGYSREAFGEARNAELNPAMTGLRPVDPQTGEFLSQSVIAAGEKAGLTFPSQVSLPKPQVPQAPIAPMGQEETRAALGGMTLNEYLNAPAGTPGVSGLRTDPQGRMITPSTQPPVDSAVSAATTQPSTGPVKVPDELMSQVSRPAGQTAEFRDGNRDGIEDREQGIFRPGELIGYDAQGNEVRSPGTQQPVNRIPATAQPPASALSSFEQDSLARQQRIGGTGSFEGDSEAREARVRANERRPGESQADRDTRVAQSKTTGGQTEGLSFDDARRRAEGQLAARGVRNPSASQVNALARALQQGEPERLAELATQRAKDNIAIGESQAVSADKNSFNTSISNSTSPEGVVDYNQALNEYVKGGGSSKGYLEFLRKGQELEQKAKDAGKKPEITVVEIDGFRALLQDGRYMTGTTVGGEELSTSAIRTLQGRIELIADAEEDYLSGDPERIKRAERTITALDIKNDFGGQLSARDYFGFNLNSLTGKDKEAYNFAINNPDDERSQKILDRLGAN